MVSSDTLGGAVAVAGLLRKSVSRTCAYDDRGLAVFPYLVHLDRHGGASGNRALAGHSLRASIASDVIAGDTRNGVVVQGKTSTDTTVNLVLVTTVHRHVGVSGEAYLIDAVDPKLLERGVAGGLLGEEGRKGREDEGLHS